jgi:uncharacterized protein (DUF305 family)
MTSIPTTIVHSVRTLLLRHRLALLALVILAGVSTTPASAQSTPQARFSCDPMATPAAGHGSMHGSGDSHAMHGDEDASFDQLYIDMMVPHHDAVIALAQAALPTLTDPVLIEMAEGIIAAQTTENAQLLEWRLAWFGDATVAMDDATMGQMMEAMPVGSMDDMMLQMDPQRQVSTFCAADDPDRAFAEQVLAHHLMAVHASEIALTEAEHPELVAFAEQVIIDQQREIDILRAYLDGAEATPTS